MIRDRKETYFFLEVKIIEKLIFLCNLILLFIFKINQNTKKTVLNRRNEFIYV